MACRKSAWHHYNFKSSEDFIQFLSKTNCKNLNFNNLVTPTLPKKLSKSCSNFISYLFTRANKMQNMNLSNQILTSNTAKELLEHEFFLNHSESQNLTDSARKQNDRYALMNNANMGGSFNTVTNINANVNLNLHVNTTAINNNFANSGNLNNINNYNNFNNNVILSPNNVNVVSNNKASPTKLVNILNSTNSMEENNAMFTVSMTVQSGSQLHSINANPFLHNINSIHVNNNLYESSTGLQNDKTKKIQVDHILEEIDPSKENSPVVKTPGKKFFEFNSTYSDDNTYNYVHEANKSLVRKSNIIDTINNLSDNAHTNNEREYNKFNNFNYGCALETDNKSIDHKDRNKSSNPINKNSELDRLKQNFSNINNINTTKIGEINKPNSNTSTQINSNPVYIKKNITIISSNDNSRRSTGKKGPKTNSIVIPKRVLLELSSKHGTIHTMNSLNINIVEPKLNAGNIAEEAVFEISRESYDSMNENEIKTHTKEESSYI